MKKLYFIFFLSVFLFDCHKDHHTYLFIGNTYNRGTHVPLANARIDVGERFRNPHNGNNDGKGLGRIYSDQNGNFRFQTNEMVDGYEATIFLISMPNVNGAGGCGRLSSTNYVTALYETLSRIQFTFINTNPVDQYDSLFNIYISRPDFSQYVTEGNPFYIGTNVNFSTSTEFYGYSTNILHYSVSKNSILQYFTDTVIVADPYAPTTIQDTIRY